MAAASTENFDVVIVGAGIFGLHAAQICLNRGQSVIVVEQDREPFQRASLINQARVHLGYHYPRSLSTGLPSVEHFNRFHEDFKFAILDRLTKVYAISNRNSMTSFKRYEAFCEYLKIPLKPFNPDEIFRPGTVAACYETAEFVFDGKAIGEFQFSQLKKHPRFAARFDTTIVAVRRSSDRYILRLTGGHEISCGRTVNASYSGINQIHRLFALPALPVKYELTELVLGQVPAAWRHLGVTLMDGAFFSLMPWGDGGQHSLSAVQYTPRETCQTELPQFSCMAKRPDCRPEALKNCDSCPARPESARDLMCQTARRYLRPDFTFNPEQSRFAVKVVLKRSEVDDSRPTVIERLAAHPDFVSVLSGKINTIYEFEKLP